MPAVRRFPRFIAAVLATVALVIGGSIAASPAFAAGTLTLGVFDLNSSAAVANFDLTFVSDADASSQVATTDALGSVTVALAAGDYTVTTEDDGIYRVQSRTFTVGGGATSSAFALSRHGMLTGTVPADAVGHVTITPYVVGSAWQVMPASVSWAGQAFSIVFDDDASNQLAFQAALFFDVDGAVPYLDTYLGSNGAESSLPAYGSALNLDLNGPLDVGVVPLRGASFVEGTVSGAFGAIDAATVTATPDAGATVYTATTDASGTYTIVLPAGDGSYDVTAAASGYLSSSTVNTTVDSANNWRATGRDFALVTADANLLGTIVDQAADPYAAGVYLFAFDSASGSFDPTPVYYGNDDTISVSPIVPGTYRLALADAWGGYLPITQYTASNVVGATTVAGPTTVTSDRPAGDCFIEFTVTADQGDYVFDGIALDPSAGYEACDQAPWGGSFEGNVTNYAAAGVPLTAELYSETYPYSPIDAVPVRADGSYELQGITSDDNYFVLIRTPQDAEWFDTFSDGNVIANTNMSSVAGVPVLAGHNSTGNDFPLVPAVIFTGTVSAGGDPADSACVVTTGSDSSTSWCAYTDATGSYLLKAPLGIDYTLMANMFGYDSEFYVTTDPNTPDVFSGAVQNTFAGLDFDLTEWPPSIYGYVYTDPYFGTQATDVTVHLYAKIGTGWGEVASYGPDPFWDGSFFFAQDDVFPDGDGLPAHDYRVRIEAADGSWLAVSDYSEDGNTVTPSPDACYIDLNNVTAGPPRVLYVSVNVASSVSCADEPAAPNGTVTGSIVESASLGGGPVADQTVILQNSAGGTVASAVTNSLGEYTMPNVPAGNYSIAVPTRAFVSGEHSYVEKVVDRVLVAGGATLAPIDLVRYGNISGQIDNWVPTSTPTQVQAFRYNTVDGEWEEANGIIVDVASDGSFEVPGIDVDGDYTLWFHGPNDSPFLDGFWLGAGSNTFGNDFAGTAEQDYALSGFDLTEAQHIHGTVSGIGGLPLAGAIVTAENLILGPPWSFSTQVGIDGTYDLRVFPSVIPHYFGIYSVSATAPDYYDQWYLNASCACGMEPIFVGELGDPAIEDVNFALNSQSSIVFDTYNQYFDESGSNYVGYEGVVTHIYKKVSGGWQEITTTTSAYTGYALGSVSAAGDYRLRFSIGSLWLQVAGYDDFADSDHTFLDAPGDGCYVESTGLEPGDYVTFDFDLDDNTAPGVCGAEPAIVIPAASGSTTGSTKRPASSTGAAAPSAAPTTTPTPSPTPSATGSPDDGADQAPGRPAEARPDAPSDGVPAPGLDWLLWLLVVLGVLGVGTAGVVILRRR
jgi:hypothetical protein